MQKGLIKNAILDVVRATLVALVVNVAGVLIVAVVAKYTPISEVAATAVNQVLKVVSLAVGALIGMRGGRLGWLTGALTGAIYTTIGFGVFSLLSGNSLFADVGIFDYLLGIGAGAAAGVAAVNLRGLRKSKRTA